jgi:hypothetical protein
MLLGAPDDNDSEMIMRLTYVKSKLLLTAAGVAFATMLQPAAADDMVGIESCDKFLATYKSCIVDKATGEQRSKVQAEFDKTKANWKSVAATAAGKAELEATCKKTTETLRAQVASLNCPW